MKLTRRDAAFLAVCVTLAALAIVVVVRGFDKAFPEASIDFRFDREASRALAEQLLARQKIDVRAKKHAALFDSDHTARIFLERSLGLEEANRLMRKDVRVWYWHHRWFTPLVEEEVKVDVATTGELVAFHHQIPEDRAIADRGAVIARAKADAFLTAAGAKDLQLVSQSERRLPQRVQRIYTWESRTIRPANATYRHTITVDGDAVTSYEQRLKVPDAWLRSYRDLRSKNQAAGQVDMLFNVVTLLAALVIFIQRLRRGDLHGRFVLTLGAVSAVLVTGVALNSMPSSLAFYDTRTSYPAFLAQQAVFAVIQSLGTAMLLIVICGAGEVLYRERFPSHVAIPRLSTWRALMSKRVFLGMVLGYALVPLFMAYQVMFYLTARRFGAWSPADLPYDDMVNTAIPWIAVLFAGFFPAFSEEFLSRAFSIPLFERLMRSKIAAIVLAGFIWGFGHAMYPNQPFWIRGVEVGVAGVIAGILMFRYGLLPLLIWHYTIDAIYTAALLFRSGNSYYVFSAALASLLFAIPLIASVVLYVRNRGFVDDFAVTNGSLPVVAPLPAAVRVEETVPLPGAVRSSVVLAMVAVIVAIGAVGTRPDSVDPGFRISREEAKAIARRHLRAVALPPHSKTAAIPVEGFRRWNEESGREDGGAPGATDNIAATYLARNGADLRDVFRRIEAGTYTVRFFTPQQKTEWFVEVDPRTARVIGYHRYQDEAAPGAKLEREAALHIARNAFATYGVDVRAFELKEALTYQQPNRRDWLFHFEEKTPLAAQGYRRATVRVAGGEVTQFAKHVKVPESVDRAATEETLVNVVLFALMLAGFVTLLGLAIAGLVMVTREHGLPWRRALRWTLWLAPVAILGSVTRYEWQLYGYPTSIAWETFRIGLITDFVRNVGLQLGAIFLALAGVEAALPYAWRVIGREGRARFGRSAALATITAVALAVIAVVALSWLDRLLPSVALSVPEEVALPWAALVVATQALVAAIVVPAAVLLFAIAAGRRLALLAIAAVFCASLSPGVTLAETPLMLVRAVIVAALIWIVGRYVLNGNPLAWPLAVFTGATSYAALLLLQNHRPMDGVALLVVATLGVAFCIYGTIRA